MDITVQGERAVRQNPKTDSLVDKAYFNEDYLTPSPKYGE